MDVYLTTNKINIFAQVQNFIKAIKEDIKDIHKKNI